MMYGSTFFAFVFVIFFFVSYSFKMFRSICWEHFFLFFFICDARGLFILVEVIYILNKL